MALPITLVLQILSGIEKAVAIGKTFKEAAEPIIKKLKQVHEEGRELTPSEFEEVEAMLAVNREELHRDPPPPTQ